METSEPWPPCDINECCNTFRKPLRVQYLDIDAEILLGVLMNWDKAKLTWNLPRDVQLVGIEAGHNMVGRQSVRMYLSHLSFQETRPGFYLSALPLMSVTLTHLDAQKT